MRTDYSVTIKEVSKELTHKERVQITDLTDCVKLDAATQEGPVLIDLDYYAVLQIHNEKSTDKDYENYVIVDKNGVRYSTGSKSFFNNLVDFARHLRQKPRRNALGNLLGAFKRLRALAERKIEQIAQRVF